MQTITYIIETLCILIVNLQNIIFENQQFKNTHYIILVRISVFFIKQSINFIIFQRIREEIVRDFTRYYNFSLYVFFKFTFIEFTLDIRYNSYRNHPI